MTDTDTRYHLVWLDNEVLAEVPIRYGSEGLTLSAYRTDGRPLDTSIILVELHSREDDHEYWYWKYRRP